MVGFCLTQPKENTGLALQFRTDLSEETKLCLGPFTLKLTQVHQLNQHHLVTVALKGLADHEATITRETTR
jgi:hypothetical protein